MALQIILYFVDTTQKSKMSHKEAQNPISIQVQKEIDFLVGGSEKLNACLFDEAMKKMKFETMAYCIEKGKYFC